MKNILRSRSLFPGISLFIFTLTLSLVVLMIVFPPDQHVTAYGPSSGNAFEGNRYPPEGAQPGSMSTIMKKQDNAYTGNVYSKTEDANTYILSLTGAADTAGMSSAITAHSRLGFYELYTFRELTLPLSLLRHKKPSLFIPAGPFLPSGSNESPSPIGYVNKTDTAQLQAMLQGAALARIFPADTRLAYRDHGGNRLEVFALRNRHSAVFSEEYIIEASSRRSRFNGEPQIVVSFADDTAADWEHLITANKGRPLAACIDNRVVALPVIAETAGTVEEGVSR